MSIIFSFALYVRIHTLLGFPHAFGRFMTSIMIAAEPVVPRHLGIAVVTFEIPVMQLVVERPDLKVRFVSQHQVFKAGMTGGGRQHQPVAQKHETELNGRYQIANAEDLSIGSLVRKNPGRKTAGFKSTMPFATHGFIKIVKAVGGLIQIQTSYPTVN